MKNIIIPEDLPGALGRGPVVDSIVYARRLLIVVALLTVFGLTMLYSTSYNVSGAKFFQNQLLWVVIGSVFGLVVFFFGYRKVASLSTVWIAGSIVLLLIALFCFDPINGAYRWIRIRIPGVMLFSLQPSELAKVALALFVARYCSENLRTFSEFRWKTGLLPLGGVIAAVLGCILLGHDLGTTILAGAMAFAIMMAAGLYMRYFIVPVGLAAATGVLIYFFDPMRLARITSFLQPELYAQTKGYQLYNSLLALGSGGWFGIGFMSSRMKAKYLPEAHTDFILAIVGEELGLLAILLLIAAYGFFVYYGLKISMNANSRLGMLLGFGLTAVISFQALINLAVISGSAPTKGMPAPFISYGGSNMIVCLISVGLLLSIAADTVHPGYNEEYLAALKRRLHFLPFIGK